MKEFILTQEETERTVLVGLITNTQNEAKANEYLDELAFLAETAGALPVKKFLQRLDTPNSRTFVGSGKLSEIKAYIEENFGMSVASNKIKKLASTIRQLELFPHSGPPLRDLLAVASDYRYLVAGPNYVFYRIEKQSIKIVRVLNEQQNFIQILFGISNSSDSDSYWKES